MVPPSFLIYRPVFLYLFFGRCRKGDYQEYVEMSLNQFSLQGDVLLLALGVSDQRDLTDPELVRKLLAWMREGCLAAMLLAILAAVLLAILLTKSDI